MAAGSEAFLRLRMRLAQVRWELAAAAMLEEALVEPEATYS